MFKCPHCGSVIQDKVVLAYAGSIGGKKTARRGREHFRWLQSLRKSRRGGRPQKVRSTD